MDMAKLETTINTAFEDIANISPTKAGDIGAAVAQALELLDTGTLRVAEKIGDEWVVNQWLKKAVLLSFRLNNMRVMSGGADGAVWWDKVPSKFDWLG